MVSFGFFKAPKVLPSSVKLELLGVDYSRLAVGSGPTFSKAQAKLNRAVKRNFPTLFDLDLNQMVAAVSSDTQVPQVTVTSITEVFRLKRVNVFVPNG